VAALPDGGAVALKLDDGGDRARTPVLTAALRHLGVPPDRLAPWLLVPVSGGENTVGEIRAAASVSA
jgi:L-asparaginase II